MSDKKAFPLWVQTKWEMMQSLWEAQAMLDKYRKSQNPAHLHKFQNLCVSCWVHIRPYRDKFKQKNQEHLIADLEGMLLKIPIKKRGNFDLWINIFKFLSDAYKRLGISDVAKQEDDPYDDWKDSF